jgi:hypothetical protein
MSLAPSAFELIVGCKKSLQNAILQWGQETFAELNGGAIAVDQGATCNINCVTFLSNTADKVSQQQEMLETPAWDLNANVCLPTFNFTLGRSHCCHVRWIWAWNLQHRWGFLHVKFCKRPEC